MKQSSWYKCHGQSWSGIITPESFAHPAKFSRALIRRIYEHAIEQEYIAPGACVVDPFGGVALGALHAMQNGLHWVGCELEEKFVGLGHANIELWNTRYAELLPRWGTATLLQGDSRELAAVLGGAGCVVSSPPYAESLSQGNKSEGYDYTRYGGGGQLAEPQRYGESPGQLGAMPTGDVSAVISSPPYAGSAVEKSSDGVDLKKQYVTYRAQGGGASFDAFCKTQRLHSQGYGNSDGQMSTMVVGSPPYAESLASDDPDKRGGLFRDPKRRDDKTLTAEYGDSVGQLGAMKAGAVVSSPPYEAALSMKGGRQRAIAQNDPTKAGFGDSPSQGVAYSDSPDNLGNENGDTFWRAARTIMEQCYQILTPGAVAIWVLKAFVRNKAIVDFPGQWQKLGEACGFETVEVIHAWLVEDRGAQYDLFGGLEERKVERKSFFRRLYEKKYPGNSIDFEVVLVQRKRETLL